MVTLSTQACVCYLSGAPLSRLHRDRLVSCHLRCGSNLPSTPLAANPSLRWLTSTKSAASLSTNNCTAPRTPSTRPLLPSRRTRPNSYGVLRLALAQRQRWALGRMVLGGHRQVVLVRPADTTLVLH